MKRQKAAFPAEEEGDDQIGLNSPTFLRKKVAFALPEKLSYQALSHSNIVKKEPLPKTDSQANGSKDILASPSGISTWKQVQLVLLWVGSGLFFLIMWTQTFLDPFVAFLSALTLGGFFIWWRSYQKSLQFKRALALQLEELVIDKLVEQV